MEGYVWEFPVGSGREVFLAADGINPETLIRPDGTRVKFQCLAEQEGYDHPYADYLSKGWNQKIGDRPVEHGSEFNQGAVEELLSQLNHNFRIKCPGESCGRIMIGKSELVEMADDYGLSLIGDIASSSGGAITVFEILKDYGVDKERIASKFGLENPNSDYDDLESDKLVCKRCGVTIYSG